MPSLLQINATCNWGSTGRIAEQISLLAMKNGWTCYTAHGVRYVRETKTIDIPISSGLDTMIHACQSVFCGRHGLGSKQATRKFIDRIKLIKPDIIHLHNIHGYYVNYPILFSFLKESGIPVVWTLHDCWGMTGQCTHFEYIGCDKWKSEEGCRKCVQLNNSYRTYIDRSSRNWMIKKQSFASVDNMTLVAVSKWLAGIVKQSYLSNKKIRVIYNGVDLESFCPLAVRKSDINLPEDKFIVLGVSSEWGERKGLQDFVKLAGYPDLQLVLIGVTEKQKRNLPSNIISLQRTNNQYELVKYYSCADLFVNPSYEDSFPTVNIEALACGTPIVAYRTGGSPEAIDEHTGIVVEKGNLCELIDAIEKIKKNGKEFYSKACRDRAVRHFNKNDRFAEYIELYEELLAR